MRRPRPPKPPLLPASSRVPTCAVSAGSQPCCCVSLPKSEIGNASSDGDRIASVGTGTAAVPKGAEVVDLLHGQSAEGRRRSRAQLRHRHAARLQRLHVRVDAFGTQFFQFFEADLFK